MKKIRKGDVVMFTEPQTSYCGELGILVDKIGGAWHIKTGIVEFQPETNCIPCDIGMHWFPSEFEVIGHIDETPEVIQLSSQGPCLTSNHRVLCKDGSFKEVKDVDPSNVVTCIPVKYCNNCIHTLVCKFHEHEWASNSNFATLCVQYKEWVKS